MALGLLIVLFALFSSYGIFRGDREPPEIFSVTAWEQIESIDPEILSEEAAADLLVSAIFPGEVAARSFNLFAWALFAFIAILGGSKIADIGIKMIRP